MWLDLASTHIQFYNFEGPQLHVAKCHHAQILICSYKDMKRKHEIFGAIASNMVKLQQFEVEESDVCGSLVKIRSHIILWLNKQSQYIATYFSM